MHANSYIQIIALNEIREGVGKASGQPYRMQDCECILLGADGQPTEVGVLMLSKEQVGVTTLGTYAATFTIAPDKSKEGGRRIRAVLTGLQPVRRSGTGFVPADAPKAAGAAQ